MRAEAKHGSRHSGSFYADDASRPHGALSERQTQAEGHGQLLAMYIGCFILRRLIQLRWVGLGPVPVMYRTE